jgi:hypothetical protein
MSIYTRHYPLCSISSSSSMTALYNNLHPSTSTPRSSSIATSVSLPVPCDQCHKLLQDTRKFEALHSLFTFQYSIVFAQYPFPFLHCSEFGKRLLIGNYNADTITGTMAILDTVPGIEVAVCIDKRPLREFEDDDFQAGGITADLASKTVSKYVQSDKKEFAIKLKVQPAFNFDFPTLGFQVYIDGSLVRQPILRKIDYEAKKPLVILIDRVTYAFTEGSLQRPVQHKFRFSRIDTSKLYMPFIGDS